jgi:hypothetical protein
MIKLDKSIHFNILTIFAIVFVCVYLYYTISDLKKIAVEVKKHSQDITNIITNLATLNKDIADIKKNNGGTCQVGGADTKKAAVVVPKVTVTAVKPSADAKAESAAAVTTTTDNAVYDDQDLLNEIDAADAADAADADSVNTIEVKKMLSCLPGDNDDDDLDESPVNDILAAVEDVPSHELGDALEGSPYLAEENTLSLKDLSVDELKKQTLDTLKAYCKENNLSTRGTKDTLIQLIKA